MSFLFTENRIDKENELGMLITEMKKIGIEKLPYSYSAIEPFIDEKTMNIHYNKHYKGYVSKLNKLLKDRNSEHENLEDIVRKIDKYPKKIRNNAGGAFNHALFWKMLSPKKKNIPENLEKNIIKNFGSLESFKEKFETYAKNSFGSGWVWLVLTKTNRLKVFITTNQDNPLMNIFKRGGYPILGLDLWEHSYYLKYQNNRDSYIEKFWDYVDWDFVNELFEKRLSLK